VDALGKNSFRIIPCMTFNKQSIFTALCVLAILLVAFVLRFAAFDHPLATNGAEGLRDLFVAKHALLYGEWPIGGHANGLSTIENSPLYYYLVILLALPGMSFLSVSFMYVLFQCLFILLVFLFARSVFGRGVGLVAALLLAISPHYVVNVTGFFIWPPYFAAPFVILSLFALWVGYRDRKKTMVMVSPLLMLMALAIHQSTIAIIPLYACIGLYVTHKICFSFKHYGISLIASLVFATVLFIPPILASDLSTFAWGTRITEDSPITFGEGLHQTIVGIPYMFGMYGDPIKLHVEFALALLLVLVFWFFFHSNEIKERKKYLVLLLIFIAAEIAVALVFDPEGIPRHFEPVLWMAPVVLGVLIATPIRRSLFVSIIGIATLSLFVFSSLTDDRLMRTYPNIGLFDRPRYELMEHAVDAMVDEINSLQVQNGYTDYTFFYIYVMLASKNDLSSSPLLFWLPLEERLGVRLDESPNSYFRKVPVTHRDDYLFYACFENRIGYSIEACLEQNEVLHPEHTTQKVVFEFSGNNNVAVYLAKRTKGMMP